MADIGENLASWIKGIAGVTAITGQRVHQNSVPADYAGSYIWFARVDSEDLDELAPSEGQADQFFEEFDIECVSLSIDDAIDLAKLLRGKNKSRPITPGQFGSGSAQGIFVGSHSDDYNPRNVQSDERFNLSSLRIKIAGHVE